MNPIKTIETEDELEVAKRLSRDRLILLLKHSTACLISARAYRHYKLAVENLNIVLDCYILKVIEHRDVSDKIALDLGVVHQTPQMFFINNHAAVWNASHWAITRKKMAEALAKCHSI